LFESFRLWGAGVPADFRNSPAPVYLTHNVEGKGSITKIEALPDNVKNNSEESAFHFFEEKKKMKGMKKSVGVPADFRNSPAPSLLMAEYLEDTSSLRAGPDFHKYDSFLRRMNEMEVKGLVSLTQNVEGKGSTMEIDAPPDNAKNNSEESAFHFFEEKKKMKGMKKGG
jgi:hypothetical protein